jgi:LAS superfamily LD-carboxypeptidase LdcB
MKKLQFQKISVLFVAMVLLLCNTSISQVKKATDTTKTTTKAAKKAKATSKKKKVKHHIYKPGTQDEKALEKEKEMKTKNKFTK